jgi:peptidoglycan hydrolase-like protein with peptidoglycan-binding domain
MTNKYPYGYARPPEGGPQGMGTMLTWEQMMTKSTVARLDREVLRRLHALIDFAYTAGVPLGVGTGWRQTQPDKPGFAPDGNSNHQSFSPPYNAVAIDTVPNISWDWLEKYANNYGFRTFRHVNNEPWHIQPAEIPAGRKWRVERWHLETWPLPVDKEKPPISIPPVTTPPTTPVGVFTLQLQKTTLDPANQAALRGNGDVFLIQYVAAGLFKQTASPNFDVGKPDGDYGPRTQTAVKEIQKLNQLTQDAICGPNTWAAALNADGV